MPANHRLRSKLRTVPLWRAVLLACSILVVSAAWVAPAGAHHSFAIFDQTRQVKLVGVVRVFQWTNPHSWVQLEVTGKRGVSEEWTITALSPNLLRRNGWTKSTLKAGDEVTVIIHPLRDGKKGGNLVSVTLPDGQVLGGGAE